MTLKEMTGNLRFFSTIFSKSYLVLDFFEKTESTEDQIIFQEESNYDLNSYIFKNIDINGQGFESQYYIDFINFFLNDHLKKRRQIFKVTRPIGRVGFIIVSYLTTVFYFIKTFLKSILSSMNEIDLKKSYNKNYNIICFGFPSHSFVNHELALSNCSFVEYLRGIKNFSNKDKILSLEEYSRPSLNKKSSYYERLKFYERDLLNKKINLNKAFKIINVLFEALICFFQKINKRGILNFIYFFKIFITGKSIEKIISKLEKSNIKNQNIFFNQFYDIGILKYESKMKNFHFFNYSQNIFVPPSQAINNILLGKARDFELNKVLRDITFNIFSLYSPHKQINLVSHLNFYNLLIKKINHLYKVNLLKVEFSDSKNISNLGFEILKKISLKSKIKNIIIYDLPIESHTTTLKRHFTGDLFCSSNYLNDFYDEIIKLATNCKVKLYIKPKYSIQNKMLNNFYEKIIHKLKLNKIKYEILNPYEAIILEGKKFDLAINLPYTSTYKTQIKISKKTIFYAPKNYHQYFKDLGSRVFNFYDLKQFL